MNHASDCAVHNEPAMPAGPCDCGAMTVADVDRALAEYQKALAYHVTQARYGSGGLINFESSGYAFGRIHALLQDMNALQAIRLDLRVSEPYEGTEQ